MSFPDLPPLSGMKRADELFSSADLVSLADDVRDRIPGLSTSAAFFSSLRQNLHLHDAPFYPSPISTPRLNPRASLDVLPRQPSPHPLAAAQLTKQLPTAQSQPSDHELLPSPSFADDGVDTKGHECSTAQLIPSAMSRPDPSVVVTSISSMSGQELDHARSDALRLLKHSLARDQALLALRSLAMHPLNIALLALLLVVTRVLVPRSAPLGLLYAIYRWQAAVLVLSAAIGIYWPMRRAAAEITADLATACDDEILVARWTQPASRSSLVATLLNRLCRTSTDTTTSNDAGPVIGILILATRTTQTHTTSSSATSPRSSRSGNHHRRQGRGGSTSNCIRVRGSIRAWAVQPGFRGRGVGEALLRAAYAGVARRGGPGGEGGDLGVAQGHAFAYHVVSATGEGGGTRGLSRVLGRRGALYGGPAERRERAVRDKVKIVVERVREERAAEGRGRRNSGGKK